MTSHVKTIFLTALLVVVVPALALGTPTSDPNAAMTPERTEMVRAVAALSQDAAGMCDDDLGYYRDGFCLYGSFLDTGSTISATVPMKEAKRYMALEDNADTGTSVSIAVHDGDGKVIAEDSGKNGMTGIAFTVPKDGDYVVSIKLTMSQSPRFCAMALLESDGVKIARSDIEGSAGHFIAALGALDNSNGDYDIRTSRSASCWALVGLAASNGAKSSMTDLKFGAGTHFYQAVTSDWKDRVSLQFGDTASKQVKEQAQDGLSILAFSAIGLGGPGSKGTTVQATLVSAEQPRMMLVGLFDMDKKQPSDNAAGASAGDDTSGI